MNKLNSIFFLLIVSLFVVKAQEQLNLNNYKVVKEINLLENYKLHRLDHLGNVYFVNENILIKLIASSYKNLEFKNPSLGNIYSYDISNPLKILVFYKESNTIIWLDNNLSPISKPLKLDDLSVSSAELVCNSVLNGFWIYDNKSGQVNYYDKNLKLTAQTPSLTSIIPEGSIPNYLEERNNNLYVNVPSKGVFVFELTGAFQTIIPLINLRNLTMSNNNVQYYNDYSLINYDIKTNTSQSILLSDTISNLLNVQIVNNNLMLFKKDKLILYIKKN